MKNNGKQKNKTK